MYEILIPADFSVFTENSIRLADQISACANTKVHLLINGFDTNNLYTKILNSYPLKSIIPLTSHNAKEYIDNIRDQIAWKNADLVIAGINPEESKSGYFNNDVYEKFVSGLTCPMIFINASYTAIKDIGVLIHRFKDNELKRLKHLNNISRILNAKLHLYHVVNNPSTEENNMAVRSMGEIADKYKLEKYSINIINNDNLIDAMNFIIWKKNLDMTAILDSDTDNINFKALLQEVYYKKEISLYYYP